MSSISSSNRAILSSEKVLESLDSDVLWLVKGGRLCADWEFADFKAAFGFVTQAALLFERQNHHGDVHLSYRHVRIELYSHDVQGLTQRDVRMAQALSDI